MEALQKWATILLVAGLVAGCAVNLYLGLVEGRMLVSDRWRPGGWMYAPDPEFGKCMLYQVAMGLFLPVATWFKFRTRPSP